MSYMICTYHINIYFRLNVIYTYIINYTIELTYICKFYILDLSRSEKDVEFDFFFFFFHPSLSLIWSLLYKEMILKVWSLETLATASLETLGEVQNLEPYPRLTESEMGVGPKSVF